MINSFMIALVFSTCFFSLASCGAGGNGNSSQTQLVTQEEQIKSEEVFEFLNYASQGTLRSKDGTLRFINRNEIELESWVKLRHSTNYYKNDYFITCQFQRKGNFKILRQGDRYILSIKDLEITTLDARLQNEYPNQKIERKLKELCTDFSEQEVNSEINAKILSLSENHIHFYYTPTAFGEYDHEKGEWKSSLGVMGDDYSNFYIVGTELDITRFVSKSLEGTYSNEDGRKLTIENIRLLNSLAYKVSGKECETRGSFNVVYSLMKGLELRTEYIDPEKRCDPQMGGSASYIVDVGYGKTDPYIYLLLPFGYFDRILERSYSPRFE